MESGSRLGQFIPTDFILVRFEIIGDLYSMNDYFNKYLSIKARGYQDTKDFNLWTECIRKLYLQIKFSLASEKEYKDVVKIMDEVIINDKKLTDKEAREVTLKINEFAYDIGLTNLAQEKKDLSKLFGTL